MPPGRERPAGKYGVTVIYDVIYMQRLCRLNPNGLNFVACFVEVLGSQG